jgi:AcrR family transcriptional regulator
LTRSTIQSEARRRPGRPRDPVVDAAIAESVVALLREVGYADLTIEAVAQRAGVGHTSIYRRWPSKAYMVHEVVFHDPPIAQAPAEMPFDELVRGFARGVFDRLGQHEARAALPGLMADAQVDPELFARLVNRFEPAARAELRRAAKAAVERGELRADANVDRLYDAIIGVAFAMPYFGQRTPRRRLVDSLVDVLLDGIRVQNT